MRYSPARENGGKEKRPSSSSFAPLRRKEIPLSARLIGFLWPMVHHRPGLFSPFAQSGPEGASVALSPPPFLRQKSLLDRHLPYGQRAAHSSSSIFSLAQSRANCEGGSSFFPSFQKVHSLHSRPPFKFFPSPPRAMAAAKKDNPGGTKWPARLAV